MEQFQNLRMLISNRKKQLSEAIPLSRNCEYFSMIRLEDAVGPNRFGVTALLEIFKKCHGTAESAQKSKHDEVNEDNELLVVPLRRHCLQ